MHKQRLAVMIAAGVGVLSTFLPWVSVSMGFLGNYTASGLSLGWPGYLTFLGCAAAGVFAFLGDDRNAPIDSAFVKFVAIAGAVPFLVVLLNVIRAVSSGGLGFGIWLALLASLAIVAVPFVIKDSGEFSMPTKDSIKDEFNEIKDN